MSNSRRTKTNGQTTLTSEHNSVYLILHKINEAQKQAILNQASELEIDLTSDESKLLGEGSFQRVKLGLRVNTDGTFSVVAIRTLKSQQRLNKEGNTKALRSNVILSTLNEIRMHARLRKILDCTYLCLIEDYIDAPNHQKDRQLFQILPLAILGDGNQFNERVRYTYFAEDPEENRRIRKAIYEFNAKRLITLINYLNQHGCHPRDIKISNLLFHNELGLTLADFGSAILYDKNDQVYTDEDGFKYEVSSLSHRRYAPPFKLLRAENNRDCDHMHDLWALGLTLLELMDNEDINQICSNFFTLAIEYKNHEASLSTDGEAYAALLHHYQIVLNTLRMTPRFINLPAYLKQIIVTLLEIDADKRLHTLEEVIAPFKDNELVITPEEALFMSSCLKKIANDREERSKPHKLPKDEDAYYDSHPSFSSSSCSSSKTSSSEITSSSESISPPAAKRHFEPLEANTSTLRIATRLGKSACLSPQSYETENRVNLETALLPCCLPALSDALEENNVIIPSSARLVS